MPMHLRELREGAALGLVIVAPIARRRADLSRSKPREYAERRWEEIAGVSGGRQVPLPRASRRNSRVQAGVWLGRLARLPRVEPKGAGATSGFVPQCPSGKRRKPNSRELGFSFCTFIALSQGELLGTLG